MSALPKDVGDASAGKREAPTKPLHPRDEADLEWFFSAGQIAFERSTFGGMLERASLFSIARFYRPEQRPVYDELGHVIGLERAITARPTAEVRQPAGYVPDSDTLERYAHVSTTLKRVERRSRIAAVTLECLYGDLGQRWATNELFGRLGAVFHLTAKGKQLIQDARVKGTLAVADVHRMETIVTVQRVQPKPERGQALAYCAAQAQVLAMRARGVWADVRAQVVA